jgi:hypothetical protein
MRKRKSEIPSVTGSSKARIIYWSSDRDGLKAEVNI